MGPATHDCSICEKKFKRRSDLQRHLRTVHGAQSLQCPKCGVKFTRMDNYERHLKTQHPSTNQTGGSDPVANTDEGCITEEQAINGNLKKETRSKLWNHSSTDNVTLS